MGKNTKKSTVTKSEVGRRQKSRTEQKCTNSETQKDEYENCVTHSIKKKTKMKSDCDVTMERDMRQTQCDICGKSLSNKGALYKHLMVVHQKLKRYMCEVCGQSFGQHGDLKRHKITHTGEKLFKCEVCGKMLSKGSCLKLHMRIHTGEKPYQCKVCSKYFAIHGDLKRHARIHSGERQYTCTLCARTFGRKEHLSAHYVTHSRTDSSSRFICQLCGEVFNDKTVIRKHYVKHIGAVTAVISNAGKESEKSSEVLQNIDSNKTKTVTVNGDEQSKTIENGSDSSQAEKSSVNNIKQVPEVGLDVVSQPDVHAKTGISTVENKILSSILPVSDSQVNAWKPINNSHSEFSNESKLFNMLTNEHDVSTEILNLKPCVEISPSISTLQFEQNLGNVSHLQCSDQTSLVQGHEISQENISQIISEKSNWSVTGTQENTLGQSDMFMQDFVSLIEAAKVCLRTDVGNAVPTQPPCPTNTGVKSDHFHANDQCFSSQVQTCMPAERNDPCSMSGDTNTIVTTSHGFSSVPFINPQQEIVPTISQYSNINSNITTTGNICDSVQANSSQRMHEIPHFNYVDIANTHEIVNIQPIDKSGSVGSPIIGSISVCSNSKALAPTPYTFISAESESVCAPNTETELKMSPSKPISLQSESEKNSDFILEINNKDPNEADDAISDTTEPLSCNDDTEDENIAKQTQIRDGHVECKIEEDSNYETEKESGHPKSNKPDETTNDGCVTDYKSSNYATTVQTDSGKCDRTENRKSKRSRTHLEHSASKKKKRNKTKKDKERNKREKRHSRDKANSGTRIDSCTSESVLETAINDAKITNSQSKKGTKDTKSKTNRDRTKMSKDRKEKSDYICDICGLAFRFLAQCKKHQFSHTGEKPHKCILCDKSYALKGDLKLHIESHSNERLHMCELCGNSYKWAKSLKIHKQTHAESKPHKCDFCSIAFYLKADLARHSKGHSGVRPHKCKICQKNFSRKEHLKTHSFIHLDTKPNKCKHCDKSFAQKVSLQKHMTSCYGKEVQKGPTGVDIGGQNFVNPGTTVGYNMMDLLNHF